MNYKTIKLQECCLSISDGDHQPPPKAEKGIPFVTISNIDSSNHFDFGNTMHVPQSYYDQVDSKRKPKANDILYSVVGSFGIPVFMQEDMDFVFQRHIAIIRPDESAVVPKYLYYVMHSKDFYSKADAVAVGAAQRTVSLTALRNIEISLPEYDMQKKISEVLSAYDDLIDNNQKQIKLLEEAAQRLYKEWFVDLHFPGYEDTKIVDGLPEGWERKKLCEITEVQYGYAFDGSKFNSNGKGTPIIRIRNIPDSSTGDYTTEEAGDQYIVNNGDIVVGMDGQFHINSWAGDSAYLVQRVCSFRPKKSIMKGFLLQAIYEPIKFFEKTVVGATVAHLGKKHIDSIELLLGPDELYAPFQTMFEKRQILMNQIVILKEARDRILLKLMTEEIEV